MAVKKGNVSGFFFGLGQGLLFFILGIVLYICAIFVRDNPGVVTV